MARASIVCDIEGRYCGVMIDCPGCVAGAHMLPTDWCPDDRVRSPHYTGKAQWGFNGDLTRPTLSPSILSTYHWGPERTQVVCHSFVRDGQIQFLGDCTHALAGQTVDLPEVEA
ncbi:hypothetical protein DYQ93_11510 [Xanthomonas sp. LMG 8992]|uniref:DUF6527 family protein n=1 Tax=Xanthomonas sp. LMG 8992 TaxID=1591157 RepID=UPI001368F413|nr:DUF6527 family protein [Xanthomonas sp. LMG 8992]MXV11647.1 hypothetical protein [Xanthomonas sp. LMG 8992]